VRGHLLTTTGKRLENVGIRDFCDIVYAYAISGTEVRHDFRKAFTVYIFDLKTEKPDDEDTTFEGFQKQSLSMLDELDEAFF